ncbi:MAG: hypothetical protein GX774_16150 [Armatimonadetes bacterium]|nr:hypothetical protein [Armatimonadota bacterium]
MTDNRHPSANTPTAEPVEERLPYTPPQVILYSEEELLQRLGPVRACWTGFSFDTMDTDVLEMLEQL